jgi:hypothetical protein
VVVQMPVLTNNRQNPWVQCKKVFHSQIETPLEWVRQ